MSLDRYQLGELVCVQWNPDMAARFPKADHHGCRGIVTAGRFACYGWHCNRCGEPTNMFGHHDCQDRP